MQERTSQRRFNESDCPPEHAPSRELRARRVRVVSADFAQLACRARCGSTSNSRSSCSLSSTSHSRNTPVIMSGKAPLAGPAANTLEASSSRLALSLSIPQPGVCYPGQTLYAAVRFKGDTKYEKLSLKLKAETPLRVWGKDRWVRLALLSYPALRHLLKIKVRLPDPSTLLRLAVSRYSKQEPSRARLSEAAEEFPSPTWNGGRLSISTFRSRHPAATTLATTSASTLAPHTRTRLQKKAFTNSSSRFRRTGRSSLLCPQ